MSSLRRLLAGRHLDPDDHPEVVAVTPLAPTIYEYSYQLSDIADRDVGWDGVQPL